MTLRALASFVAGPGSLGSPRQLPYDNGGPGACAIQPIRPDAERRDSELANCHVDRVVTNQVRGGLLYQARFEIVAHQEIKNATLNLGRGWVIRAIVLYVFVVFVMRIVGRRELGTLTPFDLVLPIVLGDAIQQGLTQDDYSVTGAIVAVSTLAVSDPGCQ